MKVEARRCIAALMLAGVGLAGCETISSDVSPSLTSSDALKLDSTSVMLRGSIDQEPTEGRWAHLLPRPKPDSADAVLLADVKPEILRAESPLQCVPFARDASGVEIRGDAARWWKLAVGKYTRGRRPQEGAVLVLRGYKTARRGHVAVVRQILDDRTIVVDHANWGNDGRIYLSAPVRDESPKNDWSKVRVWYTPGETWGKRIYRAKGFIYPSTAVAAVVGGAASGSN